MGMCKPRPARLDLPVEWRPEPDAWRSLTQRIAWRQAPNAARLFIPES